MTQGTADIADPRLAEVLRRLIEAYQPLRIYLFGSQAPERRRSRLAYMALRGTGTAADVLVCTREHFEERLHIKPSLPATVLREGRLLYAA